MNPSKVLVVCVCDCEHTTRPHSQRWCDCRGVETERETPRHHSATTTDGTVSSFTSLISTSLKLRRLFNTRSNLVVYLRKVMQVHWDGVYLHKGSRCQPRRTEKMFQSAVIAWSVCSGAALKTRCERLAPLWGKTWFNEESCCPSCSRL